MKTWHKKLSYFVTGSCIKCEKCDLLVLCFQLENVIHLIVNTGAVCVCHFHDIWEFWLLIKMLERETELVSLCVSVCVFPLLCDCTVRVHISLNECVCVFVVYVSSVINAVFY